MTEIAVPELPPETPPTSDPQQEPIEGVRVGDWLALASPQRIVAITRGPDTDPEEERGYILELADGQFTPPIPPGSLAVILRIA